MSRSKGLLKCLKNKDFRTLTAASVFNRLGDSIDFLAMSWLMFQLSHSASLSAAAVGVNFLPTLFLQPFLGAWTERVSKKKAVILADFGRVFLVLTMLASYMAGLLTPVSLLAITFGVSTLEAVRNPAASALLPVLLTPEEYDRGAGVYQGALRIMELAGTGLAGILIAASLPAAFLLDSVCFGLSALLACPLKTDNVLRETQEKETYLTALKAGLRYLASSKKLVLLAGSALFLNIAITPLNALQTPLVREVYGKGSIVLSMIGVCIALGMVAGSLLYPCAAAKIKFDKMFLIGGILNVGFYAALWLLTYALPFQALFYFGLAAATLFFSVSMGVLNTAVSAFLMRQIPKEFMARETALLNAAATAAIPLTSFFISIALTRFTEVEVLQLFSVGIGVAMCILWRRGTLQSLGEEEENEDHC